MIKAFYLEQQDARLASQLVADKSLDADKQQRIEKPFIHQQQTMRLTWSRSVVLNDEARRSPVATPQRGLGVMMGRGRGVHL